MRLVMAGPLAPRPWDPHYFEREVRPHIASDRVIYLGELGPADLERVYRGAACALFPMEWEEPFSLRWWRRWWRRWRAAMTAAMSTPTA